MIAHFNTTPLIAFDARLIAAQAIRVGIATDSHQQHISFHGFRCTTSSGFNCKADIFGQGLGGGNLAGKFKREALFHQQALECFGCFFIHAG